MPLELDENQSKYQIRSFTPGLIKVNDLEFTRSIIITPNFLIEDWLPQSIKDLSIKSFDPIVKIKPDVLLIGTGENMILLPTEVYGELINQGIGVEIMSTSAACRTYNALSSENRHVAAALLIR